MKRTNSSDLLLRNITRSIQSSMNKQFHRTQNLRNPTLSVCRSSPKLPNPVTHEHKDNRIFILEKQIAQMERELEHSKSAIRSYSKELEAYENTTGKIAKV